MASGYPDYITPATPVTIVIDKPVPSQPKNESAAGGVGRYEGNDLTYQTVVSWTVATGKVGELKELTIITDQYEKTEAKLTVGDVEFAVDWLTQNTLPIIFEDLKLAAGKTVTIECRSTDGTDILVDAIITAKETG